VEEGRWVPKGKERVRKGAVPRRKPGVGSKTRQHAERVGGGVGRGKVGSILRRFPSEFCSAEASISLRLSC